MYKAMKAFEDHQRRKGETVSHGTAKEILAGFAVNAGISSPANVRVSLLISSLKTRVSTGLMRNCSFFDKRLIYSERVYFEIR